MKKIGVIHATEAAVEPLRTSFSRLMPEAQLIEIVNQSLFELSNRPEGTDAFARRVFARVVFEAADAGAEGILIACNAYTSFVPMLEGFLDIPIIAVDRPMLERAVNDGTKIGVIATNPAGGPSAQAQMEIISKQFGKKPEFAVEIVEEALKVLKAGDTDRHDMLIAAAGRRLVDKGCDVIVLAQISMARAAVTMQELKIPVLTSPDEGVLALRNAIHAQTRK